MATASMDSRQEMASILYDLSIKADATAEEQDKIAKQASERASLNRELAEALHRQASWLEGRIALAEMLASA